MRENIYFYFMHTHILFILSLVLLCLNTTTATSFGHQQLVAAAVGAAHTCIDKERQALLDFKAPLQDPDDMLSTWRPEVEDDCCQWSGVGCNNQTGHVTELDFNDYGLGGTVVKTNIDHLLIEWQGKENDFSSILGLLKAIYLSSNNLTGQIPNEVTNLHGLLVLDLSDNSLDGKIPRDIGQMTELLTLNLSRNMLSGEIPPTMSEMTLLNNLDMSFNDLSGRIPLGTQLQTFNTSAYIGNTGLCGRPLPHECPGDEDLGVPPVSESDGDGESTNELQRWLYIGGATGFATAFWIACSALLFNRRIRHAFFHFHNCFKDWVYVKVAVLIAKFQRAARA